jgi:hypothetical protein
MHTTFFGLAVDTIFNLAVVLESFSLMEQWSCVNTAALPTQLKDVSIVERSLGKIARNTTETSLSKRATARAPGAVHSGSLCSISRQQADSIKCAFSFEGVYALSSWRFA